MVRRGFVLGCIVAMASTFGVLPTAGGARVPGAVADGNCAVAGSLSLGPGLSNQTPVGQLQTLHATLSGCEMTPTTGKALMTLPKSTTTLSCTDLSGGTAATFTGHMAFNWGGAVESHASLTVTYPGGDVLHLAGAVLSGRYAGEALSADLALTPQPRVFPPTKLHPPATCTDVNRLNKFVVVSSSLRIYPAGTLTSLAVSPLTLSPSFSTDVPDYVVRCATGTNNVTISAAAMAGGAVRLLQPVATSAASSLNTSVGLLENQAAVVQATDAEGHTTQYWIRCLPHDFPPLTVTHPQAGGLTPGYYLLGDNVAGSYGSYAMILDSNGTPVWYRKASPVAAVNVTPLGHDLIAYYEGYAVSFGTDPTAGYDIYNLDTGVESSTRVVGSDTDLHELQHLANGDFMMLSYVPRSGVDLTGLVSTPTPGTNSTIADCVVQEVDPSGNLVWQWDAFDHIDPVTETTTSPVPTTVVNGTTLYDVYHCNSIDPGANGDILLSVRNTNALFDIRKSDGTLLWKMGGTPTNKDGAPHISVVNDPEGGFAQQHDARWESSDEISMMDNESPQTGQAARGVEYKIDFTDGTAQPEWSYQGVSGAPGCCMGDVRFESDGQRVIGWGLLSFGPPQPALTELDSAGHDVLEIALGPGMASYRAVKAPLSEFDLGVLRATAGK